MNTSSNLPTDLCTSLNGSLVAVKILSTSNRAKDANLLQDIITNLHSKRAQFPQYERIISQTIFKILNTVMHNPSELMHRKAHISTICGFIKYPTKDFYVLKELTKQILSMENPQNMFSLFQSFLIRAVNTYLDENFSSKDSNFQLANQLAALMKVLSPLSKTQFDKNILHDCANTLEATHPSFKGIKQLYPAYKPKKHNHVAIKEPVEIFTRIKNTAYRGKTMDWED